jgi:hypothetical protein
LSPQYDTATADIEAERARTAPTDKSIPAEIMTIVWPIASIAFIEDCLVIFKKLLTVKKYGVAKARYVIRKSKATIGPPFSKIFLITSPPIETH